MSFTCKCVVCILKREKPYPLTKQGEVLIVLGRQISLVVSENVLSSSTAKSFIG